MNRLLVRRCSMSSIEEEDEPTTSDECTIQVNKLASSPIPDHHSSSIPDWDSELSESEQEFDDNDDDPNENGEERAANRALQNFMQTCSRTRSTVSSEKIGSHSPTSLNLYDEDDSAELDAIISELRDFKIQFEECSNLCSSSAHQSYSLMKRNKMEPSTNHPSSSSVNTSNGCVHELRTLEDQLEAALASLTLTINDCPTTNLDCQDQQQRSSGSSACSSGLGDDIANDSLNLFHISSTNYSITTPNASFISKTGTSPAALITDDCDSAFSDTGSTEKITLPHHEETVNCRSSVIITNVSKEPISVMNDQDESVLTHSQHPSKLLVRTYNDDGSTKSILVDDSMSIRDILFVLVHKNHREPDVDYALVEVLPDLHMERIFEDHQKLTEAILMWSTVSPNRLLFTKRSEKYAMLRNPTALTNKDDIIVPYEELLKTPDLEGIIYLKEKSRKSWKKHFCVLRSSGLYFVPKGKSKKDLVCLAKFENVELFFGLGWKKKFKSPSDFCFALKHPLIQKKSSKYIKYMCVETKKEFDRWITSIRTAKFGQQLKINYFLMEKAMNIYRSSGRFAAVCAARSATPNEQKNSLNSGDLSPTPCSSIRDRQVLNRTPILNNGNHSKNYYSSTSNNGFNNHDVHHENDSIHVDDDDLNDENSPIKSASYMDELRQRLERVLNDPSSSSSTPSPALSTVQSQNSQQQQQSSLSLERHSCLPVSRSFRLPVHQTPSQVQSSSSSGVPHRSSILSRVPMKPTSSSLQAPGTHLIPPTSKGSALRGPTLIAPPKLKSTGIPSCLSSTENLRTNHDNDSQPSPSIPPMTMGSTPLPRKQLQPFQVPERNFSYRTPSTHSNGTAGNSYGYSYNFSHPTQHQQQMSKSFILPTKREDHRSASSLSVASKTDSLNLDETELSSAYLDGLANTSHKTPPAPKPKSNLSNGPNRSKLTPSIPPSALKKPSATFRTNGRPQPPIPVRNGLTAPSLKMPSSISQTGLLNKSLSSSTSNNLLSPNKLSISTATPSKAVPPVPPRKSSIPRPSLNAPPSLAFKPQPPQRDSSTNLILFPPKSHVSHL